MRLARLLVALALAWTAAPSARAQLDGARLSWARGAGAEGCIEGEALAAEVRRRLGRDPFQGPVRQHLEGVVSREDGRWVARLFSRDVDGAELGSRELASDAETCHALDPAIVLALALAIDPEAALGAPPDTDADTDADADNDADSDTGADTYAPDDADAPDPTDDASGPPPSEPLGAPPADAETAPVSPPAPAPDARVQLGAHLAVDLVPGVAVGVVLTTDARLVDRVRWRVGVIYLPEGTTGAPDASFTFGLTAVTLDVCVRAFELGPLFGGACLGGAAGALRAVVRAPLPTEPGDYAWGAATAAAELGVAIEERVYVTLAVTGAVPFVRWAFRVEGRETVEFQQPEVVPGGTLSAGVRFW